MSYPAQFNTACRVHTVKEAAEYPFNGKEKPVELFLFMLDTYDVLMDILTESSDFPTGRETWNHGLIEKLYEKLRILLLNRWDVFTSFIPGRLKGWTQGLFWYILMMTARYINITSPTKLIMSENLKTWVSKNCLRSHVSFNLNRWSFMDVVRALEIIEAHLVDLPWERELFDYLDIIEYRCSELVILNYDLKVLDSRDKRMQVSNTVYQLHPSGIHELMTRCTLIRRSADLWFLWDSTRGPDIGVHYMDDFIEKEKRQLTQRKFRDSLNERINENMLRVGERALNSYRLRGADVSDYASMANNRPLVMLDALGKVCAYGTFEALMEDFRSPDAIYMGMIQMHINSLYAMNFTKYFYLSEKNIHDHKHKLHLIITPFIIQRSNQYDCMWKGSVVKSRDGSFYWAFVLWVKLLRVKCKGIVYGGVNLIPLTQIILDKPSIIAAKKTSGTLDYTWN